MNSHRFTEIPDSHDNACSRSSELIPARMAVPAGSNEPSFKVIEDIGEF